MNDEGNKTHPGLYKLLAYGYAALGDAASSLTNMNSYFEKQKPGSLFTKN